MINSLPCLGAENHIKRKKMDKVIIYLIAVLYYITICASAKKTIIFFVMTSKGHENQNNVST